MDIKTASFFRLVDYNVTINRMVVLGDSVTNSWDSFLQSRISMPFLGFSLRNRNPILLKLDINHLYGFTYRNSDLM
jgi:hypothetical protein